MRKFTILLPLVGVWFLGGCGSDDAAASSAKAAAASEAPVAIKVTTGAVDTTVKKEKSKENGGQFYYSYNKKKKFNDNSQETKTHTTIDAYLHIKSPYEKVRITMMIKRLSKNYIIKCSACHDDYANGVIGPSLLDRNASYIYNHIAAFKTGAKKNVFMKELIAQMDDTEIRGLAEEIANFNKEIRKMRNGK